MSIVNIQRDATFTTVDTSLSYTWSTETAIGAALYNSSGPAAVNKKVGMVTAGHGTISLTGDTFKGIGVFMQQPVEEPHPFRVKAYASALEGEHRFYIGIGYPSNAITGTDDVIEQIVPIGFLIKFDEVIMIQPLPVGDPNYGKPVNFAILVAHYTASPTDTNVFGSLSVQSLATSPPPFAQSVA